MKKLISLLAAVSVVSACSLAAFATDYTVDYGNSNTSNMSVTDATTQTEYTEANGVYTFDLSTVNGVENTQAQTTILAVKGTTISVGSIQYINQSSGKSFSFALKDALTEDVNVLVGGSSIQPTKVSTIVAPSIEPAKFTISGTVTGYAGATLPTVTVSDGTNNYTATVNAGGTFTVDVPVLKEGTYTLTATKLSHLKYTKANLSDVATVTAKLTPGDIVVNEKVDIDDILMLCGNNYSIDSTSPNYKLSMDLNEDGNITIDDILFMCGNNYLATPISE